MMNDLLLSVEEKQQIEQGSPDSRRLALLVQFLAPFELANPPAAHHLLFRFNIMYRKLLHDAAVCARISQTCAGFDFKREFLRLTGITIERWLFIIFGMYGYFLLGGDFLEPRPDYMLLNPSTFRGESGISEAELNAVLGPISKNVTDLRAEGQAEGTDPRYDFVAFRSTPLVGLIDNKLFPIDTAFILEKLHTGVHWVMHDALPMAKRTQLFQAWGVLFEEYVHWLLGGMETAVPIMYLERPPWRKGGESFDGIIIKDSVLVAIECKGGFLSRAGRYSGDQGRFTREIICSRLQAACAKAKSSVRDESVKT